MLHLDPTYRLLSSTMPMTNMLKPHPMEPNMRWLPYLSWFSSPSKVMTAESTKATAGELQGLIDWIYLKDLYKII